MTDALDGRSRTRLASTSLAAVLVVAVGGASGALLRHGVDVAFPVAGLAFPWPTLGINLSGSAALAALGVLPVVREQPLLAALLGPGLLGGYTTFSAYAEQTRRLLDGQEPAIALGYLLGTLLACLLGCLLGRVAGRFGAAALARRRVRSPGAAA